MIKRNENFKRSDYLLIILLLIFSGNPITNFSFAEKYSLLIVTIIIIIAYRKEIKINFYKPFFIIASTLILLYLCQLATLHFVSWLAGFRYIVTILFAGIVYYLLADRFSFMFFIAIYYISLLSFVMFILINLLHLPIPGIPFTYQRTIYIIYTYLGDPTHALKNSGMFWEPGAFAGILMMCIGLNVKDLSFLWKTHKTKVVVVILALLTTQSTTGYITFFITSIYYILFFVKNPLIKVAIIPAIFAISILAYKNADFLQEKIKDQSEKTSILGRGEFSNSRFGSFVFDLHYIKKHPLIGNGFSDITRYADHPFLIGMHLGHANGFSNYMACLGIPFMFFYLLLTFQALYKIERRQAFLVCLIIVLTLFGEQWLNFPLYLGIIFINNRRKYTF